MSVQDINPDSVYAAIEAGHDDIDNLRHAIHCLVDETVRAATR